MAPRPAREPASWGSVRLSRSCPWEDREDAVTLLVPRLGRSRVARRVENYLGLRPYKVHLDRIGTFVWRRCDGATTVAEIARDMRKTFGDRAEPVEDRLVLFLRRLVRGRFVSPQPGGSE